MYDSVANTHKAYFNGSLLSPEQTGEDPANITSDPLIVGAGPDYSDKFSGSVDDFRFYNKALSGPSTNCTDDPGSEICQIYNDGAGTESE